jgi:hypothetical protein
MNILKGDIDLVDIYRLIIFEIIFLNDAMNCDYFNSNRNKILDLITPDEFLDLYPISEHVESI